MWCCIFNGIMYFSSPALYNLEGCYCWNTAWRKTPINQSCIRNIKNNSLVTERWYIFLIHSCGNCVVHLLVFSIYFWYSQCKRSCTSITLVDISVSSNSTKGLSWSWSYGSWFTIYNRLPMQAVPITTNVVSSNPGQSRCTQSRIPLCYILCICTKNVYNG
jgi:hypothetical protein